VHLFFEINLKISFSVFEVILFEERKMKEKENKY
jgi:hypothetical protein